jgi:RimJ/RimL family protein N-acetyltransferase
MDISGFSDQYDVRRLTKDNLEEIYGLCRGNPLYYSYCPPFVTRESIKEDFSALPSGKELRDKYFLGWYEGEKLIAVMDLFYGYPDQETALIGFFMTDVSVQNAGVGTRIIDSLCQALGGLGFLRIRLGWVSGNPQAEHLWHKTHFSETGTVVHSDIYMVTVAERRL